MHELKTGLCVDKFDTVWMFFGKVLSLIRFANYPYTLYYQLNASRIET